MVGRINPRRRGLLAVARGLHFPHFMSARIRLEGRLEHLEQFAVELDSVSDAVRRGLVGVEQLDALTARRAALEPAFPVILRERGEPEVGRSLAWLQRAQARLDEAARAWCARLGLTPHPRLSPLEILRVQLPLRYRTWITYLPRAWPAGLFLSVWVLGFASIVAKGEPELVRALVAATPIGLFATFLAVTARRVVVTKRHFIVGRHRWSFETIASVRLFLAALPSRRLGATLAVVCRSGRVTTLDVPNGIEAVVPHLQAVGIPVELQRRWF
jgi:hypothetical protein